MDLEQLLDQRDDPAIRRQLDALAQSNAEVADALRLQDRIDAALARVAMPPSPDILAARLRQAAPAATAALRRREFLGRLTGFAAAAAIVMAAVGYWWLNQSPPPRRAGWQPISVVAAYEREKAGGFKPFEVCHDPSAYRETFQNKLGQGLIATAMPAAVTLQGWAYGSTVSPESIFLMAKVQDQQVLVIFDRLAADQPQPAVEKGLHVHRRAVDNLVLYEVSPLDKPFLIDQFQNPGPP